MEKGASVPWQDVLLETTGEARLDPSALREYFRPLEDWLRTENLRRNELVGWTYGKSDADPIAPSRSWDTWPVSIKESGRPDNRPESNPVSRN
jgi:hypothetical protein